jgi:hypothetical protein
MAHKETGLLAGLGRTCGTWVGGRVAAVSVPPPRLS